MKVVDIDKHASLLRLWINYDSKKFYRTGAWTFFVVEGINQALINFEFAGYNVRTVFCTGTML
jgi:hypothetical protein